jgi:hypothetical protein
MEVSGQLYVLTWIEARDRNVQIVHISLFYSCAFRHGVEDFWCRIAKAPTYDFPVLLYIETRGCSEVLDFVSASLRSFPIPWGFPSILPHFLYISLSLSLSPSVAWVRFRTIPTERPPLVGEVSADRGCRMVGLTDPCGRIRGFLDRSRYFSF